MNKEKEMPKITAKVVEKQITVDEVVVSTGMDANEFYNFMFSIKEAIKTADDAKYNKYREVADEMAKLEEDGDKAEAESLRWRKDFRYNEWQSVSNLYEFFVEWLEANKEWSPEYEEPKGDESDD